MKHSVKIILLILVLIFFTGCSKRYDCSPIKIYDFDKKIKSDGDAISAFQIFIQDETDKEIIEAKKIVQQYYDNISLKSFNENKFINKERSNFNEYGYENLILKSNGELFLYIGYFCK